MTDNQGYGLFFKKRETLEKIIRQQLTFLNALDMKGWVDTIENLQKRDLIDSTRAESPLKKATDAIEIDTTYITLDEQVEMILQYYNTVLLGNKNI